MRRLLVAGFGNVLRGDDGFGPAVVEALRAAGLPPGVQALDVGLGGLTLVQELLAGYDGLVLVDAVERGASPGSLHLLEPAVPDAGALPEATRRSLACDAHGAVPEAALVIARAAGALPSFIRIVGCQPAETDEMCVELTPGVRAAVPKAVETIARIIAEFRTPTLLAGAARQALEPETSNLEPF